MLPSTDQSLQFTILQFTIMYYSVLQCTTTIYYSVQQCTTVHYSALVGETGRQKGRSLTPQFLTPVIPLVKLDLKIQIY